MQEADRMELFLDSLEPDLPEGLRELEQEALKDGVPIIRPQMQSFLKFVLALHQPMRILEVGTAIGFSALLMSEFSPQKSHITTIEKYEKRIPLAKENFRRFGREDRITLLEGDAAEILKDLDGPFDLIFMDAAKGQYIHFLPDILRLMPEGGLLLSDNILQEGDILESRYAVTRRDRTIHARMRDYLFELKHNDLLETIVLPVADGLTLSVKRKK